MLVEEGVQLQHVCWGRRQQLGPSLTSEDEVGRGGVGWGRPHLLSMADSQAWLTSWKMVARDCGSPWKEDMALGDPWQVPQGSPNLQIMGLTHLLSSFTFGPR